FRRVLFRSVCEAVQDHPRAPRRHPRRRRAQALELEARRIELEDPAHQPPWLRAPLRRGSHRDDLPLLRWDHRAATHGKVRRTRYETLNWEGRQNDLAITPKLKRPVSAVA